MTGTALTMLEAIEDGIVRILDEQKLFQLKDVDIESLQAGIGHPAAFVSIESGTFEKVTQVVRRCRPRIFVVIVFRQLQSEKARRHGLYPILMGTAELLTGRTLGMGISAIEPARFRNVTHEKIRKMGLCAYEIELSTSFDIRMADDGEPASDMLRVGIDYFLQDPADDRTADASDMITLRP